MPLFIIKVYFHSTIPDTPLLGIFWLPRRRFSVLFRRLSMAWSRRPPPACQAWFAHYCRCMPSEPRQAFNTGLMPGCRLAFLAACLSCRHAAFLAAEVSRLLRCHATPRPRMACFSACLPSRLFSSMVNTLASFLCLREDMPFSLPEGLLSHYASRRHHRQCHWQSRMPPASAAMDFGQPLPSRLFFHAPSPFSSFTPGPEFSSGIGGFLLLRLPVGHCLPSQHAAAVKYEPVTGVCHPFLAKWPHATQLSGRALLFSHFKAAFLTWGSAAASLPLFLATPGRGLLLLTPHPFTFLFTPITEPP